jgi:hypothetical protein
MGSSIQIASARGSVTGTVERVVLSCDGCAQELWVSAGGRTKRVPINALGVSGWSGQRVLDAGVFEAAPTLS